jgi:hypothetical protein
VEIMGSRHTSSPRRQKVRRWALWAGLSVGGFVPSVGCQVEYAGMTLPSGKYMHDDVQYFPPGPDFPWANTQAATQRAHMQAMGIEPAPGMAGPLGVPAGAGALAPIQAQPFRETNVNQSPLPPQPMAPGPAGAPPAGVPAPPAPGLMPGGVPMPLPEAGGGPGAPAGGAPIP